MREIGLVLAVVVGLGCKAKDDAVAGVAAGAAEPVRDAGSTAVSRADGAPAREPDRAIEAASPAQRAMAEGLVHAWLAAQNQGDFAGYQTLYADDFKGIRRSGARTVRLDRARWMADRARMFRRPMEVAADAVEVVVRKGELAVFFTQRFAQGSYRDVGRKVLFLAIGQPLTIRREEMLDSRKLAPDPRAVTVAPMGPPGAVRLGLGSGARDRLYLGYLDDGLLLIGRTSGAIGEGDITILESTHDAAAATVAGVMARREVAVDRLPAGLSARLGARVQALGADLSPLCQPTIKAYHLMVADWAAPEATDAAAAAAQLMAGEVIVVATLDGLSAPCAAEAAFARDLDLPALPTIGAVADVAAVERAVGAIERDGAELSTTVVGVAGRTAGAALSATHHAPDRCDSQESYATEVWRLEPAGPSWHAIRLGETGFDEAVVLGADVDGDGVVEVVTTRSVLSGAGAVEVWLPDLATYWPAGLGCDGCDGDDC